MSEWIIKDDDYGWDDEMDDEVHIFIEVECPVCECGVKFVPPVEWYDLPEECPNCGNKTKVVS